MPHQPSRSIHDLLPDLRIDYPHPNDPPKEPLMRTVLFLPLKPLQLFMVEEGLNPKVVVHPQGLELLGQGKVCENHIMDLNCNKSVFNQLRPDFLQLPVVQTGSPTRSSRSWPGDGVNTT